MTLRELLETKRAAILARWVEQTLATYPVESRRHLSKSSDPFGNPVGHALKDGLRRLLDHLIRGQVDADRAKALDGIIRIRSVQAFSAGTAVGFVLGLKRCAREVMRAEVEEHGLQRAYVDFEDAIDALALAAFDNYMMCREQIYEIRAKEAWARSAKLIERANRIVVSKGRGMEDKMDPLVDENSNGKGGGG